MYKFGYLFTLCLLVCTLGGIHAKDDYTAKWIEVRNKIMNDPELKAEWDRRVKAEKDREANPRDWDPPKPVFECDTTDTSPTPPTSVHALRPGDINMVAAMGDSVTAGNGLGAEWELEIVLENRGESWSVGADFSLEDEVVTLTNILRKFNPDVKGGSICVSSQSYEKKSWMNVAEPGGDNKDMPDQAWDIVNRVARDDRIDGANDWKVVTLFIGGNDLCGACDDMEDHNSTQYRKRIEQALDIMHDNLPRTLVNVVPMFDVTPLKNFSQGHTLCPLLHINFCSCVYTNESLMRPLQWAYYTELKDLIDSGKYDVKDDFTVVLQPIMVNMTPPIDPDTGMYDQGFLSYDCFHPSRKAHQAFAYILWQSMFLPVGSKPLEWDTAETNPKYLCPTEDHPYIFTSQNSNVGPPPP